MIYKCKTKHTVAPHGNKKKTRAGECIIRMQLKFRNVYSKTIVLYSRGLYVFNFFRKSFLLEHHPNTIHAAPKHHTSRQSLHVNIIQPLTKHYQRITKTSYIYSYIYLYIHSLYIHIYAYMYESPSRSVRPVAAVVLCSSVPSSSSVVRRLSVRRPSVPSWLLSVLCPSVPSSVRAVVQFRRPDVHHMSRFIYLVVLKCAGRACNTHPLIGGDVVASSWDV